MAVFTLTIFTGGSMRSPEDVGYALIQTGSVLTDYGVDTWEPKGFIYDDNGKAVGQWAIE